MAEVTLLQKCKLAMRINGNECDDEISEYIESCKLDLGIGGVILPDGNDSLINTAVITYVRMRFGNPPNYDKLKDAYDEQKAQLMNATGYTLWSDES